MTDPENPAPDRNTRLQNYQAACAGAGILARLDGFVCLGPAPDATPRPARGISWLSALPDWTVDASLSLAENIAALRHHRRSLAQHPPEESFSDEAALPAVVGVLHYEAAYHLEPKLMRCAPGMADMPLQAGLYTWCLVIDHNEESARLYFHPQCPHRTRQQILRIIKTAEPFSAGCQVGRFSPLQQKADYLASVARVRDYIDAGDCYQVNLSQQFEAAFEGAGWEAYRALSPLFPTPQSGFVSLAGSDVLSLSPEVFMNVSEGIITTRPIKGTRARGETPARDRQLAEELQCSVKDRAENLMIVDLLRNDLGRLCKTGSVEVDALFALETYANVHHLVSTVRGVLREELDALDALLGCFPGGSITGAPKIRAMEIIAELEPHQRGPYCGTVFRWDSGDRLQSNIAIRTLWRQGNRIRCWGGGGIVHDSDPEMEYQETLTKVSLLMRTLEDLHYQGSQHP